MIVYQDETTLMHHDDATVYTGWADYDNAVMVTDPPYGRGWRQGNLKDDAHNGIIGDDDTTTRDRILEIWGQHRPWIMFGDPLIPPPPGAKLAGVYQKHRTAGIRGAIGGYRRDVEMWYLGGKGWGSGIGGRSSLIRTNLITTGKPGAAGHPHAKPQDVLDAMIRHLPDGVRMVVDPFAGSGSTLVAARAAGFRAVGVEIDAGYAETAARRLALVPAFGW